MTALSSRGTKPQIKGDHHNTLRKPSVSFDRDVAVWLPKSRSPCQPLHYTSEEMMSFRQEYFKQLKKQPAETMSWRGIEKMDCEGYKCRFVNRVLELQRELQMVGTMEMEHQMDALRTVANAYSQEARDKAQERAMLDSKEAFEIHGLDQVDSNNNNKKTTKRSSSRSSSKRRGSSRSQSRSRRRSASRSTSRSTSRNTSTRSASRSRSTSRSSSRRSRSQSVRGSSHGNSDKSPGDHHREDGPLRKASSSRNLLSDSATTSLLDIPSMTARRPSDTVPAIPQRQASVRDKERMIRIAGISPEDLDNIDDDSSSPVSPEDDVIIHESRDKKKEKRISSSSSSSRRDKEKKEKSSSSSSSSGNKPQGETVVSNTAPSSSESNSRSVLRKASSSRNVKASSPDRLMARRQKGISRTLSVEMGFAKKSKRPGMGKRQTSQPILTSSKTSSEFSKPSSSSSSSRRKRPTLGLKQGSETSLFQIIAESRLSESCGEIKWENSNVTDDTVKNSTPSSSTTKRSSTSSSSSRRSSGSRRPSLTNTTTTTTTVQQDSPTSLFQEIAESSFSEIRFPKITLGELKECSNSTHSSSNVKQQQQQQQQQRDTMGLNQQSDTSLFELIAFCAETKAS